MGMGGSGNGVRTASSSDQHHIEPRDSAWLGIGLMSVHSSTGPLMARWVGCYGRAVAGSSRERPMLGGPGNSTEGGVLLNVWGGSRSISYWVTHSPHRTQSHPLVGWPVH